MHKPFAGTSFSDEKLQDTYAVSIGYRKSYGRFGAFKPLGPKLEQARAHISDGLTVREAVVRLKVGKTSFYKALRDQKPN